MHSRLIPGGRFIFFDKALISSYTIQLQKWLTDAQLFDRPHAGPIILCIVFVAAVGNPGNVLRAAISSSVEKSSFYNNSSAPEDYY